MTISLSSFNSNYFICKLLSITIPITIPDLYQHEYYNLKLMPQFLQNIHLFNRLPKHMQYSLLNLKCHLTRTYYLLTILQFTLPIHTPPVLP